ncbi:MAG TPA: tRNA-guanine transglycosylase [Herpetosiphonaceae bacterium]
MTTGPRVLQTRRGIIRFPAYIPVTTFGNTYPLDRLIRPYLPRLAPAVMVSYHYAKQMTEPPAIPVLVDSGGFAALLAGSQVREEQGLGTIVIARDGTEQETVRPFDVLELQERVAEVAFTLDLPIPPGVPDDEARRRQQLTMANALWALHNRRRRDLPLYAVVQAWDAESARSCVREYVGKGFDGVAIGGLVPRVRNVDLIRSIIAAVREEIGRLPVHVFGLGNPDLVETLFQAGVDSVDSSAYAQLAAEGRLWGQPRAVIADPTPTDRLHLALCNLAAATGRALPLAAARLTFETVSIRQSEASHHPDGGSDDSSRDAAAA